MLSYVLLSLFQSISFVLMKCALLCVHYCWSSFNVYYVSFAAVIAPAQGLQLKISQDGKTGTFTAATLNCINK